MQLKVCCRCHSPKPEQEFYLINGRPRGKCRACYSEYQKERYQKDLERRKAMSRADFAANRERRMETTRAWRARNPRKMRDARLRRTWGIGIDEYEALLVAQGGRCAVCHGTDTGIRWACFAVDHDHNTGAIRGLLCRRCNVAIGLFEDTAEFLRSGADYLDEHRQRRTISPLPISSTQAG